MEGQKSLTFHSKILIFLSEMNKSLTALERHERVNDERIVPNFLGELSLSLLENIMHVFEYLLNVSDIEEKKKLMFSFTGRNICQSLRSIISTLFYVHSLCLC